MMRQFNILLVTPVLLAFTTLAHAQDGDRDPAEALAEADANGALTRRSVTGR